MSTRATMTLLSLMGTLMSLFMWLGSKTGTQVYAMLVEATVLGGGGLMCYAFYREQKLKDTSGAVSKTTTVATFTGVALWIGCILYRALAN